jgi:hypothetical protein
MERKRLTKSFWQKPEGIVGGLFLLGSLGLATFLIIKFFTVLAGALVTPIGMAVGLITVGLIVFMALDSRTRSVVGYMYQSLMRWITGIFVKIDPMSILNGYVDDLKYNLKKMNIQIGKLRKEKHKLMEMIFNNSEEIKSNMDIATKARVDNNEKQLILKTRKAGRLKESNVKLETLLKKMEVMQRVLTKMSDNSYILIEDIEDQVKIKSQEQKAIMASHSAMKSAMNIIKGDKDKKAMFDQAMEVITDDVSLKVGEMENFMDMSEDFMNSIDIQNGIFEEKGMKMLEEWEAKSDSLILGAAKQDILNEVEKEDILELDTHIEKVKEQSGNNEYDDFF